MEGFGDIVRGKVISLKKTLDIIRAKEQPLPPEELLKKANSFYDKLLSATEGQHLSLPLDPTEINNSYEFKKDSLTFSIVFEPFFACYVDPNREKDPKRGLQTMKVMIKEPSGAISENVEVVRPQDPKRSEEANFTYEKYIKAGRKYKKLTERNTMGAWEKIEKVLGGMSLPVQFEEPIQSINATA